MRSSLAVTPPSAKNQLSAYSQLLTEKVGDVDALTKEYRQVFASKSDRWLSAARTELGDVFKSFDRDAALRLKAIEGGRRIALGDLQTAQAQKGRAGRRQKREIRTATERIDRSDAAEKELHADAVHPGDWVVANVAPLSMAVAIEEIQEGRARERAAEPAQAELPHDGPEARPLVRRDFQRAASLQSDATLVAIVDDLPPELESVANAQATESGLRRQLEAVDSRMFDLGVRAEVLEHLGRDRQAAYRRAQVQAYAPNREQVATALQECAAANEGVTQQMLDAAELRAAAQRVLAERHEAAQAQSHEPERAAELSGEVPGYG